jgi:hypothetical protein
MSLSVKISARVIAGRLVLEVSGEPPTILFRVVTCPCCGEQLPEPKCRR